MKQRVNQQDFINAFEAHGRLDEIGGKAGARLLFEYLEELESGISHEIELDPIALCCNFSYYENKEDALDDGYKEEEILCENDYGCFVEY